MLQCFMTYYSDKILLLVKLSVIILLLALIGSTSLLFMSFSEATIALVRSLIFYTYYTSLLALVIYLYGSYVESKKLITCTGCKVVNYVGNFIAYVIINSILLGINVLIW